MTIFKSAYDPTTGWATFEINGHERRILMDLDVYYGACQVMNWAYQAGQQNAKTRLVEVVNQWEEAQ